MQTYSAPLRDMRFLLHEVLNTGQLSNLPGFEEATADVFDAILEEGAKFCENQLLPLNQVGDQEGCKFENGIVRTPPGFKKAYDAFIANGWHSISGDPTYGGQGLPETLSFVFEEMVCSTNFAFGVYPLLSRGAATTIAAHASEAIKDTYLPKLGNGSWTGTMCLTESHCGTDLGLIKTKAMPDEDGSFKISGTKIFITAGEHDLSENIVHLVLAKLPGSPEGVRGISLFVVPKFIPNTNGSPGTRNTVSCGSIEEKMGIHGSSTCVLHFDEAKAWLIGKEHSGLKMMFTMMNGARLGVGLQGLGIGEVAYQSAAAYAKDRRQGKSIKKTKDNSETADAIIVHPDVRLMLLQAKALNEGARALAYETAIQIDISNNHENAKIRQNADEYVQLMTPIVKAFLTDNGSQAANLAIQIHGGHGYIREHGIEQFVRDARIAQIYEGTNGIQALDLVGRKLGMNTGRLLKHFFHPAASFLDENKDINELENIIKPLLSAFNQLQQITLLIAQRGLSDPEEAGAAATDYLRAFGLVAVGYMWAKMAKISIDTTFNKSDNDTFYEDKVKTARFYMKRVLPETAGLFLKIKAGKDTIMSHKADAF
jgi:alkylation response protein AidB-like acyl-CoA dehydrogenase